MKKQLTFLSLSAILLGGCRTSEIPDSELPDFVDKIVLNASIDNQNPIEVEVSNSVWAYESGFPEIISDVELILTSGDQDIPLTYNSSTKTFQSAVIPKVGQQFTLIAARENYRTASAYCQIPTKVQGKSAGYIENGGIDMDGNKADLVFLKFTDAPGLNYYIAHFYYYSSSADLFIPFEFELTDETLRSPNTVKLNDGGYLFDDRLFNGSTKEFKVVPPSGITAGNPDIKYLVELRSITEDYYKYQTTLQQYRDNQDQQSNGPFGSAVIVHSNVAGGLGVFLSSTLESDTIR
ncbi:MAG: DUF4249 domain-containing protein [Flavobacteriales bacterium]|nr:DUF4249 domain-containing protein [Bacteroidota bacterium]MCB9239735.1 DUF4249 domain-containing protein [Flavobacteriales bacterium]